ncbi:abortive infection family protein, partial [Leptospira selangorensis]
TMTEKSYNPKDILERLQKACIDNATGSSSYETYEEERSSALSNLLLSKMLPDWVVGNRYGSQYWNFIKSKFPTYKERRNFIYNEFSPIFDYIEKSGIYPISESFEELLKVCNSPNLEIVWRKCIERRINDPEGAITSARTLLESTCIYILEMLNEIPDKSGDLQRLYKQLAKSMNLAPDMYHEQVFKQILSGCGTVVDGLAGLRNKLGDAHGQETKQVKPSKRHAELAVNLSGTLCSFLISTYEEKYRN